MHNKKGKQGRIYPGSLKGAFDFLVRIKIPYKVIFLAMGILSTAWFLVRVIPKPSRAEYPCIKAASPFMSSFIIYLISLGATVSAFKKAKSKFFQAKYIAAASFACVALIAGIITLIHEPSTVYGISTVPVVNAVPMIGPNQPVGSAKGIFPGRVVWVWDSLATNENCTGKFNDGWYMDKNTDLNRVDSMMINAVLTIAGKPTIKEAWDTLFRYFNVEHNKGNLGYSEGEKIFIKFNNVGGHAARMDATTHARKDNSRYANSQSSAQSALSLLRQLINDCGIPQENISIGDPSKHFYKDNIDMWRKEFPKVHYIGSSAFPATGQEGAVKGAGPGIFYSDKGSTVLNEDFDFIPTAVEEASYLINMAALKGHARGGITSCAKNHFGTQMRGTASHLHFGLAGEEDTLKVYGKYKVLVDMMGHNKLGGNTVLCIIDGLWAGADANFSPDKWSEPPFNGDWTSSIFVSQDHVAIESVCLDFLQSHYRVETMKDSAFPQYFGVDDYLMQAASSDYWPAGIIYDPENDGTPISSLGVFEHWNNPVDKQYSRNLGTGDGIELIRLEGSKYVLSTPGNLSAAALSETEIELAWVDLANCEYGYILEISADGVRNWTVLDTLPANTISYIHTGLNPGTKYFYRLRAEANGISSGYSNVKAATTLITGTWVIGLADLDESLKTYPNPFKNKFTIELSNNYSGLVKICVIDISGRLVYKFNSVKIPGSFVQDIDLSVLKPGSYILGLTMGSQVITSRITRAD